MRDKRVLFRIGGTFQYKMRFGEAGHLLQSAYFCGKDKGYTDGNIFLEWPLKIAFNAEYRYRVWMKCPSYSILPIKFIERGSISLSDFDEIVDFTIPNSMYDGYPQMYKDGRQNHIGFMNYLNIHFYNTGKRPIFKIPRDKLDNPYILFHIRIADWSEYRNPDLKVFRDLIPIIKEKYGDRYEIWKCGEPQRILDRQFDFVAPYYRDDVNQFFKLINNASFFFCSNSGPNVYGEMFDVPMIELEASEHDKYGKEGERTAIWWNRKGGLGDRYNDWRELGKDYLVYWKGKGYDEKELLEFTEKWLK